MRKLLHIPFIVAAILAISFGAGAKPVTAIQALQRVTGNTANRPKSMNAVTVSPQLVHTFTASATETEPMVYLFSRGADRGYLIAPADDIFPAVLGYSDKGTFDADNMPPAMKAFLEDYAREIDYTLKHPDEEPANTPRLFDPGWEPVRPLLETKWNQSEPYNDLCPQTTINGHTYTAVTGCVATALAQVMYYHKWPDVGVGSHTDEYDFYGQTLSADFSTYRFDWDNMQKEYGETYSAQAAQAVAELMYACGVAVDMEYGINESAAICRNQGTALVNYFKYSRALRFKYRDNCSSAEFEKIIYDNLKEGLPVLYEGHSSQGGHAFVCDGYSGGHYFHFNWGWGGHSDGYFYLARLNPSDQGIGSSEGGYNSSQAISYNIRPVYDGVDTGEAATYELICRGHFRYTGPNGYYSKFDSFNPYRNAQDGFRNVGSGAFNGQIGVVVRDSENNETFSGFSTNLESGYGYKEFWVSLNGFPEGTYTIHPAYRENSADKATLMNVLNGCKPFVRMTVGADGSKTFSDMTDEEILAQAPDMMVNCFNYSGKVLSNQAHNFLLSVSNVSSDTDFYGKLSLIIKDESGNSVLTHELGSYNIPAGQAIPESVNLSLSLQPATYTVTVVDSYGRVLPGEFPIEITGVGQQLTTDLRTIYFAPTDFKPNQETYITFGVENKGESDIWQPHFGAFYRTHGTSNNFSGPIYYWNSTFTAGSTRRYSLPLNLSEGEYDVKIVWKLPDTDYIFDISPIYLVRVGHPVETVTINEQGKELEKDDELQLTTTLTPENATFRTLSWSSSDKNVVSVDRDGNIKALSPGTAYISATAHNGSLDHTMVVVKGNSAIEDIDADELRTVNAVYTISGVKILTDPTEADLTNLDSGVYIFQTPKRAFTVKK